MIPTNTGILSCDIRDHFPIFCIFNDLPMSVDKPTITKRVSRNLIRLSSLLTGIS